jgi:rhodanese-related sulfurtransferase
MGEATTPIQLQNMLRDQTPPVIVDVRRDPAFELSGLVIPSAVRVRPEDVAGKAGTFSGHTVVVYCVHGHAVSRDACDILCDAGVDAYFLEGGIEGWREAGFDVEPWAKGRGNE